MEVTVENGEVAVRGVLEVDFHGPSWRDVDNRIACRGEEGLEEFGVDEDGDAGSLWCVVGPKGCEVFGWGPGCGR